ncbi:hypothetical protein TrRE_jg9179, partial [Triparma retinervis]
KTKAGKDGRDLKPGDLLDPEVLHGYSKTPIGTRMSPLFRPKPPLIEDDVDVMGGVRKVFYAARTHSQLSQFLKEIGKTKYGDTVRAVHVGGRKGLCGNREVNREGRGEDRVTEECLDLQKGGKSGSKRKGASSSPSSCGCPNLSSPSAQVDLGLHIMSGLHDIEDVLHLGTKTGTCGYYAARKAIPAAHVVAMPYQVLFSRETRRYERRLAGKNAEYCRQISLVLKNVCKLLGREKEGTSRVLDVNGFLFEAKLDNVNLMKVTRYIERSMLCRKLLGFVGKRREEEEKRIAKEAGGGGGAQQQQQRKPLPFVSKHISPLSPILSLLKSISKPSSDGKVVVASDRSGKTSVRYFMLNPQTLFQDLRDECHAVILAGGTLRPFSHVVEELLDSGRSLAASADAKGYDSPDTRGSDVAFFSCSHVVPREHVYRAAVGRAGGRLDFRHQQRGTAETMDALGRVLEDTARVGRGGIVVFLPSYKYEAVVVRRWKETGVWGRVKEVKGTVWREPKESKDLDGVLKAYERDACGPKGSVIMCVVGGKMSEGINFKDDMARVVVYYFNLCMRAVNQSIGRAIRHVGDYAAILLCDERYGSDDKVWGGLPGWIREGTGRRGSTWEEVKGDIGGFLKERKRLAG